MSSGRGSAQKLGAAASGRQLGGATVLYSEK